MEIVGDENINKPREIDNLTQQALCDSEVRALSVVTVIGTLPRKPFVDNMNRFTMERNPTSVGIVITTLIDHQPGIDMK